MAKLGKDIDCKAQFYVIISYLYKTSEKNEPFCIGCVYGMKSSMKQVNTQQDIELILSYQSGNKEVFPLLVKRWHVQFCKFAYWYCKDAEVAKDIAQESWVVIFNKLTDLKEPQKFKSWAISIVNHKAVDWIRKSNREQNKLRKLYDETPNAAIEEEQHESSNSIHQKMKLEIAKLPQHQQTVLKLFYVEELSLKEIGQLLQIAGGTAKSRLFHARESLKNRMKKYKEKY